MRFLAVILLCGLPALPAGVQAAQSAGCGKSAIEHELEIRPPNEEPTPHLSLADAQEILSVPSVSLVILDHGKVALNCAFGHGASPDMLYQAASLSKLVTAVMALRLVEQGRLDLDADVTNVFRSWHLPASDLSKGHPVTLRGLLSMTGGIGVPGFTGYEPGDPLPSLMQILDGVPPAHSPPVRVEYAPGSRYAYSGGGYEIVQVLIEDVTGQDFASAAQALVLKPADMRHSLFAQPLPPALLKDAAMGHHGDGDPLPGGSRLIPELAAGGLWSTPGDLAQLLVDLAASYRGDEAHLLSHAMARSMFTRQNGGPDGLGAAIAGSGQSLVLMKRGQNVGFESYLLIFPATLQGMVVMTDSDNGTTLAEALIRRTAAVYRWPALGQLAD